MSEYGIKLFELAILAEADVQWTKKTQGEGERENRRGMNGWAPKKVNRLREIGREDGMWGREIEKDK